MAGQRRLLLALLTLAPGIGIGRKGTTTFPFGNSARPPRTPTPLPDERRASLLEQAVYPAIHFFGRDRPDRAGTHFISTSFGFVHPLLFQVRFFEAREQALGEIGAVFRWEQNHRFRQLFCSCG